MSFHFVDAVKFGQQGFSASRLAATGGESHVDIKIIFKSLRHEKEHINLRGINDFLGFVLKLSMIQLASVC